MTGAYLKLAVMTVAVTAGQICMKKGAQKIIKKDGSYVLRSFLNPFLLLGAASVLFTPLLYFSALRTLPLSAAYGFTGLTFILVFFLSWGFLKEKVTVFHTFGIVCIASGFILWNL